MRKLWKQALREAFEAPEPLEKRKFLSELPRPGISSFRFALSQAAYIRRRSRAVFLLAFGVSMAGTVLFPGDVLWVISAFTPLLALALVSECGRSRKYEMEELELSTRLSLKSVLLARLGILGAENAAFLGVLLFLGVRDSEMGVLSAGLYITAPFLLTAFLGLCAVRRLRGREGDYACMGIAACVSVLGAAMHTRIMLTLGEGSLAWWGAAVLLLGAGTAGQYSGMLREGAEPS